MDRSRRSSGYCRRKRASSGDSTLSAKDSGAFTRSLPETRWDCRRTDFSSASSSSSSRQHSA